jgi:hypothetical protein
MKIIKLTLAIILIVLSLSSNTYAQWIQQTVPDSVSYLHSINFISSNSGLSTGLDFSSSNSTSGRAYTTTNAGSVWIRSNVPAGCRVIVSSEYVSSLNVFGAGAMNLSDDRLSFVENRNDYDNTGQLKSGANRIESGSPYRGAFFKSTNGGLNWSELATLPTDTKYLTYMDFLNANTGMVIADVGSPNTTRSNIYKTTDGGLTWTIMLIENIIGQLESIQYINENLVVATGYDFIDSTQKAVFLKTTNGGMNWSKQVRDSTGYKKVFFINNTTGFIAASTSNNIMTQNFIKSFIYKTTDQGTTWSTIFSKDSLFLGGVNFFVESGVGIAFGNRTDDSYITTPYVFRTSNFGATWSIQTLQLNPTIPINSCMLDRYNYYISGGYDFASIHHTTNGGSVGINNNLGNIPYKFSLSQNYPNPFNPSTTIKYNVPSRSQIILKVYNINGKEVAELVNEVKSQGSYETKFDAGNLPSGIYYYKLISGDFSETKKMILIK